MIFSKLTIRTPLFHNLLSAVPPQVMTQPINLIFRFLQNVRDHLSFGTIFVSLPSAVLLKVLCPSLSNISANEIMANPLHNHLYA